MHIIIYDYVRRRIMVSNNNLSEPKIVIYMSVSFFGNLIILNST